MKKFKIFILTLLAIGFTLVMVYKQNSNEGIVGSIELTSLGKTYEPYTHWVYSQQDGIAADGINLSQLAREINPDLNAGLNALEAIPASDDIAIIKTWNDRSHRKDILRYRIYDENLALIENANDITKIIGNKGIYYVVASAQWGTNDDYSDYDYIFKINVE